VLHKSSGRNTKDKSEVATAQETIQYFV